MVAGVGEIVLDILIKDGNAMAVVPGGSVFNAMVSLGRTLPDDDICMISQTGDDAVFQIISSFMAKNNMSDRYIHRVKDCQSTVSLAMLNNRNDASYEFFRDKTMPIPSVPQINFSSSDVLLFGSFFAVDPATGPMTRQIVRKAHDAGALVYYDVNFRKGHTPDVEKVLENCSLSDIVRASSEDMDNLFGNIDIADFFNSHCELKPVFITTSGSGPVNIYTKDTTLTIPVEKIETVSTVGAGDNFNAGFLYSLYKSGREMTADRLIAAAKSAIRFSSDVCQSRSNYVSETFLANL